MFPNLSSCHVCRLANAKSLGGNTVARRVICILHLPYLPLPPAKEHSGSSALSYPGAEDIMDSPYCQPCFSLHAVQLMPILPHLHLHFWQQSLHSVSSAHVCFPCSSAGSSTVCSLPQGNGVGLGWGYWEAACT